MCEVVRETNARVPDTQNGRAEAEATGRMKVSKGRKQGRKERIPKHTCRRM